MWKVIVVETIKVLTRISNWSTRHQLNCNFLICILPARLIKSVESLEWLQFNKIPPRRCKCPRVLYTVQLTTLKNNSNDWPIAWPVVKTEPKKIPDEKSWKKKTSSSMANKKKKNEINKKKMLNKLKQRGLFT